MLGRRFRHFVEINFEEKPDAGIFFKNALSALPPCEKLAVFVGTPIVSGETLLFLDEVQTCPEVLASLRYFHEQMPGLHVVAAGLVHQVFQTAGAALPLGAQADARRFKALLFDVGIHQRLSGLDLSAYMTSKDTLLVKKGSMAELVVGLLLAAYRLLEGNGTLTLK